MKKTKDVASEKDTKKTTNSSTRKTTKKTTKKATKETESEFRANQREQTEERLIAADDTQVAPNPAQQGEQRNQGLRYITQLRMSEIDKCIKEYIESGKKEFPEELYRMANSTFEFIVKYVLSGIQNQVGLNGVNYYENNENKFCYDSEVVMMAFTQADMAMRDYVCKLESAVTDQGNPVSAYIRVIFANNAKRVFNEAVREKRRMQNIVPYNDDIGEDEAIELEAIAEAFYQGSIDSERAGRLWYVDEDDNVRYFLTPESNEDGSDDNRMDLEQTRQLMDMLLDVLQYTKETPHQVVAFVSSIFSPVIISEYFSKKMMDIPNYSEKFQNFLKRLWDSFDRTAYKRGELGITVKEWIDENFYIDLGVFNFLFHPLCMDMFVRKELEYLLEETDNYHEHAFYNKVYDELRSIFKLSAGIRTDVNVQASCAKLFMRDKKVRDISGDFEALCEMSNIFNKTFSWGDDYRDNLEKEYRNILSRIFFPVDGDVIYTQAFSGLQEQQEGRRPDTDQMREARLSKNITQHTSQVQVALLNSLLKMNKDLSTKIRYREEYDNRIQKALNRRKRV